MDQLKQAIRLQQQGISISEIKLWVFIKARTIRGYQFYRQKAIHNYIVDFYCPALKLVIEIDGNYHNNEAQYYQDQLRQKDLESQGLHFLRFTEKEVLSQLHHVLLAIESFIIDFESNLSKQPFCG